MRTFRYLQISAALLWTLGAKTALADQGIVYALIINGSSPTVSAEYSLNPGGAGGGAGGGPITVNHTGTGSYNVGFPNSGINRGWVVEATAYGANSNYCNVQSWVTQQVLVNCFNSSGSPADSPFSVLAVTATNDKNIAFAWADQDMAASYSPTSFYSYNPSGSINITRASPGFYGVTFNGLNGSGGTVQIDASGSGNASCDSAGIGGSSGQFQASVYCRDTTATAFFFPTLTRTSETARNTARKSSSSRQNRGYRGYRGYEQAGS